MFGHFCGLNNALVFVDVQHGLFILLPHDHRVILSDVGAMSNCLHSTKEHYNLSY
jgi:hypothetical protein